MQDSARYCKIVQDNAEYAGYAEYAENAGYAEYAELLTADGAYHCPVGSITPFLLYHLFHSICHQY